MDYRKISILKISASMIIFGTIGLFVRAISFPSSMIALVRGMVGAAFLLAIILIGRKKLDLAAVRSNLLWLVLSGCAIGFNWILLFESYRYTSVAVSTLCYYFAPVFVVLAAPLVFREKLTVKSLCCVVAAIIGMILVSGVLRSDYNNANEMLGVICGIGAAILYASVMIMNQKIAGMNAFDKTIVQLGVSAVVLLPYCLLTADFDSISLDTISFILLIVVGVLHTGFAYYLYFGAMSHVKAQTVAFLSYIDPVVAVLISGLVLKESLGVETIVGAALILGSSIVAELPAKRR